MLSSPFAVKTAPTIERAPAVGWGIAGTVRRLFGKAVK